MSFRNKRLILIGLACAVFGGVCLLYFRNNDSDVSDISQMADPVSAAEALELVPPRATENVDGINYEISSTTDEQEQGLSDRTEVPDNYAMLFVFQQDGYYGFWMKDMDVPLDMVWVRDDGTIASVTSDIPADSYPDVFYPPEPIRYVLEVRAGFAKEKGWTQGVHIDLPLPYGN